MVIDYFLIAVQFYIMPLMCVCATKILATFVKKQLTFMEPNSKYTHAPTILPVLSPPTTKYIYSFNDGSFYQK